MDVLIKWGRRIGMWQWGIGCLVYIVCWALLPSEYAHTAATLIALLSASVIAIFVPIHYYGLDRWENATAFDLTRSSMMLGLALLFLSLVLLTSPTASTAVAGFVVAGFLGIALYFSFEAAGMASHFGAYGEPRWARCLSALPSGLGAIFGWLLQLYWSLWSGKRDR